MEHQVARRVTIADVAEAAGVSKTAVSFAFNNPARLNVDTATRIIEIADSLGYRPDPVARMLTQRRTGTIGLVTPQALASIFSNPFFGMFSAGVAAVAEDAGYGAPLHLAAARVAVAGDRAGRRSTGSSRSASPPTTRRSPRSAGPACR